MQFAYILGDFQKIEMQIYSKKQVKYKVYLFLQFHIFF